MANVRFRIGASAALALGLAALPGCKQTKRPTQSIQPKPSTPAKQQGQHSDANLETEAVSAGQELKASVKEIQATVAGDDTMVDTADMVNINYASLDKLATLPGISKAQARMIVNNRPYNTPLDLVYKKVITQAEYERLVNRVVTWDNLWTKSD